MKLNNKTKRKIKKVKLRENKKFTRIAFLSIIVVVLGTCLFSLAKYVIDVVTEHYYNSKKFYFNSETLNGKTYNIYGWDGNSTYEFVVDLNNKKDDLNFSKINIPYDINVTCSSDNGSVNCNSRGPTSLIKDDNEPTKNNITISLDRNNVNFEEGESVEVNVKATSTSPYKKELSSTFNITANKLGVSYSVVDSTNSKYLTLIISNSNTTKNVTVDFDETKLSIDNTNYQVKNGVTTKGDDNKTINKYTFSAVKGNVYSIRFYKKDITQNYSYNYSNIIEIS